MRRLITAFLAAMLALGGVAVVSATPAYADVCGDTSGQWTGGVTLSAWTAEFYFYEGPNDYTGEVVLTYVGQVALVVIDDTTQVLTGSWAFSSGTMIYSATDVSDNSYRLTMTVTADTCGGLGAVHSASGTIIQQDVGEVGLVYMTLVV